MSAEELYQVLRVLLLCLLTAVVSQREGDENSLLDDVRICSTALNQSINTSSPDYLRLSKSICKGDYYDGVCSFGGDVWLETDNVSHTGATSTIRVELNPNSTAGHNQFYYTFCVSYNTSLTFVLIGCASNEGEELEIQHEWEKNGLAEVRVGVFEKANSRDPIACNITHTTVAGNFGLKIHAKVNQSKANIPVHDPSPSSSSTTTTPSFFSSTTNYTNNTYITGNLTFKLHPEITINSSISPSPVSYFYVFFYDYGDNSSLEELLDFSSTHLYDRAGNYSYTVEGYVINNNDHSQAYYGLHRGIISVLDPISNASVRFNNNNSIAAETKVLLHTCANGTFPITVCWKIQQLNNTNNSVPITSSSHCSSPSSSSSSSVMPGECHTIYEWNPCPSYVITSPEKGHYEMIAVFTNPVSCFIVNYTFHVVDAAKPPIVATTTSVGVVVAIVLAVLVVLVLLAVGGYLPYRRYRSHMIETADFKFIDLSERKLSPWKRFKLKLVRLIRSRRNTDKIGLVNLLDEQNRANNNRSKTMSSSSSSSSSLGSCTNYNTV